MTHFNTGTVNLTHINFNSKIYGLIPAACTTRKTLLYWMQTYAQVRQCALKKHITSEKMLVYHQTHKAIQCRSSFLLNMFDYYCGSNFFQFKILHTSLTFHFSLCFIHYPNLKQGKILRIEGILKCKCEGSN